MTAGSPTSRPTLSSTSTTSAPRKLKRGSIAGEKRENGFSLCAHVYSTIACTIITRTHSAANPAAANARDNGL
jgi:hypothetical protein